MRKTTFGFAVVLLLASPVAATPIDWHLYPSTCSGGAGAVAFACGSYGRFVIRQTSAPPGCAPIAEGSEIPPGYPKLPGIHAFPVPGKQIGDASPQPVPLGAPAGKKERRSLRRVGGPDAAVVVQEPAQLDERWVAVVDFDSPHGDSTAWLADEVAGPTVDALLFTLDEAALNVLGEVSDFHVLARLCEIAQVVDGSSKPRPETINMSFGRPKRAIDPTSYAACPVANSACEIAKVAHHLKTKGSYLVAAAGNHRAQLFPAVLDEVIAAGMMDLNVYLDDGTVRPAWETPLDADALMPGNGLCLDSWAAPAGSSYSSALLAGWLVRVLDNPLVLRSLGEGEWRPAYDGAKRCIVLAKGRKPTPYCNAAVTTLFAELVNSQSAGCGTRATDPSVSAGSPARAIVPAPLASIDTWGDPTHPAPESDPCVPCTASFDTVLGSSDLHLDLSHSGPLPPGIHLDEVSLRVDDSYYSLDLLDAELQVFEDGGLAALVIPGGGDLIPPGASVSLWYQMKETLATDCASSNGCFWSSTPLLLESE